MFAILLSKGMDPFYQNISSFPTAFFTFFLAIFTLYWLLAFFGIVDIDILDIDSIETDLELGNDASTANALAGVMLKFGLHGVPVTIIISFLSLFGWLTSYYTVHFLSSFIPTGILYFLFALLVLMAAFWVAVLLTTMIVKLIKPFFYKVAQQTTKRLLGKRAVVRSSKVTDTSGEAFLNDGGAGLILKVRSGKGVSFAKGDKVILLDYQQNKNIYLVISEHDLYI